RAVLLDQPLACTKQLEPCAIDQQVQRCGVAASIGATRRRPRHLQCRRPAAQRRVVRHTQGQAEQADNGTDQALGLPVCEAEYGTQGQRRQDRQRRVPGLTAPARPWLGRPRRDRFIGEPYRQAAALTQTGLIGRPVRHLALLPRDVVTTILVQLERQGWVSASEGAISYATPLPAPTDRSVHHARLRFI